MPPKAIQDRSIILTSTTGEKSIWYPREHIPPKEVWDTVAAARILNTKTPKIDIPEESRKEKKKKPQNRWRKWWQRMTSRRLQVLETGVDTFPTQRPTLLERINDYWRPAPASSAPSSFTPGLGCSTAVVDKENANTSSARAKVATYNVKPKYNGYEERVCSDQHGDASSEKMTCQLPSSSSTGTSLLEVGALHGGGYVNPLAGPSIQRARFVHERAKSMIAASEVPSPALSSNTQTKPKGANKKSAIEKYKNADWSWLSCCKRSKNGCDCVSQEQAEMGKRQRETLARLNSEESTVNVAKGDSLTLSPLLFKIADNDKTTVLEAENQSQRVNILEDIEDHNTRQHNMAMRKIEIAKAGSASSTSAPTIAPAASISALSTARHESPDREPTLSLAQRLKALKEKHANNSGDAFEDVWNAGSERRVQGPAGTMRGESDVENGFVEVELPASNNTNPKTSYVVAAGSRVRYLPAAMEDAINTELPKPTEEKIAYTLGGNLKSDASSGGGSFKTARSTASNTSTVATVTSPKASALNNADSTKQSIVSSAPSTGKAASESLKEPHQSASKASTTFASNDADGLHRSSPINIKKPGKNYDMNGSYFKVRPQDGTDTGYPALDSSATSSDFGFQSTLLPGSWPDDDDSEWVDGKEEFEAVMREKNSTSKTPTKR